MAGGWGTLLGRCTYEHTVMKILGSSDRRDLIQRICQQSLQGLKEQKGEGKVWEKHHGGGGGEITPKT